MKQQLEKLKTRGQLSLTQAEVRRYPAILRLPTCQNRFARLGIDAERNGTVCQGCRYDLYEGCPNTRAWSLDALTGHIKPICKAEDLVYCKHYDCGCDLCANFHYGTPVPLSARG